MKCAKGVWIWTGVFVIQTFTLRRPEGRPVQTEFELQGNTSNLICYYIGLYCTWWNALFSSHVLLMEHYHFCQIPECIFVSSAYNSWITWATRDMRVFWKRVCLATASPVRQVLYWLRRRLKLIEKERNHWLNPVKIMFLLSYFNDNAFCTGQVLFCGNPAWLSLLKTNQGEKLAPATGRMLLKYESGR